MFVFGKSVLSPPPHNRDGAPDRDSCSARPVISPTRTRLWRYYLFTSLQLIARRPTGGIDDNEPAGIIGIFIHGIGDNIRLVIIILLSSVRASFVTSVTRSADGQRHRDCTAGGGGRRPRQSAKGRRGGRGQFVCTNVIIGIAVERRKR